MLSFDLSSHSRRHNINHWSGINLLSKEERLVATLVTPRGRNEKGEDSPLCWDYLAVHGCTSHDCKRAHPREPIPLHELPTPLDMAIIALGGSMTIRGPLQHSSRLQLLKERRDQYNSQKAVFLGTMAWLQDELGTSFHSLPPLVRQLLIKHQVVMKTMPLSLRQRMADGTADHDAAGVGDDEAAEAREEVDERDDEDEVDYVEGYDIFAGLEMKIELKNDEAQPTSLEEGEIPDVPIKFPTVAEAYAKKSQEAPAEVSQWSV